MLPVTLHVACCVRVCAQVWNSVDQHARRSYTSVIHGKYSHEETIATASFADTYIIVRDLAEAQMVSARGLQQRGAPGTSSCSSRSGNRAGCEGPDLRSIPSPMTVAIVVSTMAHAPRSVWPPFMRLSLKVAAASWGGTCQVGMCLTHVLVATCVLLCRCAITS